MATIELRNVTTITRDEGPRLTTGELTSHGRRNFWRSKFYVTQRDEHGKDTEIEIVLYADDPNNLTLAGDEWIETR